jgi:hypothetical protein
VALGLVVVLIRRFGFDGGLVAASSWDVVDPAAAGQCVSGGAAPARPISRPYRGGGGGVPHILIYEVLPCEMVALARLTLRIPTPMVGMRQDDNGLYMPARGPSGPSWD